MLGKYFVIVLVILLIAPVCVEGRGGGRGGGGRGGSRGGSRSSSRSSSRSAISARISSYRGPVYRSSTWQTAAAAATVYGIMSYKRRYLYHSHPNKEPSVCFNTLNLRNGTYGYFICPEPGQPDSKEYCCGEEGDQDCCTYNEYNRAKIIGAIVGGVIGGLILMIIVSVVCCCFCSRRNRAPKPVNVQYKANTQNVTVTPSPSPAFSSQVYSTPADYGFSHQGTTTDEDTKVPPINGDVPPYHPSNDSEARRRSPTSDPPQYGFKDGPVAPPYSASASYPAYPNSLPQPQSRPPPYDTAI